MKLLKYLPFSYHWIILRAIGSPKTIVDLGCGEGDFMESISKGKKWDIFGIELYNKSIVQAKRRKIYKKVIKGDVTNLPKNLYKKRCDVVIASQIIEHLDKKTGKKVIKDWERLANKRVVIGTTVGFIPYHRIEQKEKETNPLQTHRSGWSPREFRSRGYKVRGQGIRLIYGQNGIARKSSPSLLPVCEIIAYLLSPLVYFVPELGLIQICVKKIKND